MNFVRVTVRRGELTIHTSSAKILQFASSSSAERYCTKDVSFEGCKNERRLNKRSTLVFRDTRLLLHEEFHSFCMRHDLRKYEIDTSYILSIRYKQ